MYKWRPTMNDQRCPIKENTGHLIRMGIELPTGEQTVEDQPRVRQTTRLDGQGSGGTSICRVCRSQPGKSRVVPGAIRRAVDVVVSQISIGLSILDCREGLRQSTYEKGGCGSEFQSWSRKVLVSSSRFFELEGRPLTSYRSYNISS